MKAFQEGIRRRELLLAAGGLSTVGLAGCTGGDSGGSSSEAEQQLDRPVAGDPNADVTVASFEDFACPHCATYSLETLPPIWSEYVEPGEVRYEWYDFPLAVDGEHSWLAADAARSVQANADSIDAFWSYVDLIFENQDSLSLDTYENLADEVGVDGSTVRQETEDRTYEPTVRADSEAGLDRDVSRTPTIFVDGEMVEGSTESDLREAIDAALGDA